MPFNSKDSKGLERTDKFIIPVSGEVDTDDSLSSFEDLLESGASSIAAIHAARPHLEPATSNSTEINNYKTLLEIAAFVTVRW